MRDGAAAPANPANRALKVRIERPYALQIKVTARAERLIRAGVEAKRGRGLRGHAASITVVVEEALETSLARLVDRNQ